MRHRPGDEIRRDRRTADRRPSWPHGMSTTPTPRRCWPRSPSWISAPAPATAGATNHEPTAPGTWQRRRTGGRRAARGPGPHAGSQVRKPERQLRRGPRAQGRDPGRAGRHAWSAWWASPGPGKSTLGKTLVGINTAHQRRSAHRRGGLHPDAGHARQQMRREVQYIPQDPYSSLSPRRTTGQTLAEALDPRGADPRQAPRRASPRPWSGSSWIPPRRTSTRTSSPAASASASRSPAR